jgi:hypothetical protein
MNKQHITILSDNRSECVQRGCGAVFYPHLVVDDPAPGQPGHTGWRWDSEDTGDVPFHEHEMKMRKYVFMSLVDLVTILAEAGENALCLGISLISCVEPDEPTSEIIVSGGRTESFRDDTEDWHEHLIQVLGMAATHLHETGASMLGQSVDYHGLRITVERT